jgi:hypothetical protein
MVIWIYALQSGQPDEDDQRCLACSGRYGHGESASYPAFPARPEVGSKRAMCRYGEAAMGVHR